jgi:hypothetical protein
MEAGAANARVAKGVHDGERKGGANQENNIRNRRRKHRGAQFAVFYCHERGLGGIRLPVFVSKNFNSCSGTAKS